MSNLFALYSDEELAELISQVKAAIPVVLAGGRMKVNDTEYDFTSLESLKSFGDALARERDFRAGSGSRVIPCRPRRGFPGGLW